MTFILTLAVYLLINYVIANFMRNAAQAKGYEGNTSHAFGMCFWLGVIGCLYVVALPDLFVRKNQMIIIEKLSALEDDQKKVDTEAAVQNVPEQETVQEPVVEENSTVQEPAAETNEQ